MKQRIYHIFNTRRLLLPLIALTISFLASCGGGGGAMPPGPCPNGYTAPTPPIGVNPDIIVSAADGDDVLADGICIAYKTITAALTAAISGDTVWVAPGTYDAALGEIFPIAPPANVMLIGDVENKGDGATATLISGNGASSEPGHYAAVMGAEGVTLSGFKLSNGAFIELGFGLHSNGVTMTISHNTFASGTYGGIRLLGAGNPLVENNVFHTTYFGVRANTTGSSVVQNNTFPGQSLIDNQDGDMTIQGNTITSSDVAAIVVQHGSPQIINNTINSTGYSVSALFIMFSATPILRGNTFTIGGGYTVKIQDTAMPDLGTAGSPGNNVFAGAATNSIFHEAASTLSAIGNTWHTSPPGCGSGLDIEITGGGTVIWGSGAGEQCP